VQETPDLGSNSSKPYLRTRPGLAPSVLLGSPKRGRLPTPLDTDGVTFHVKARNGLWWLIRALGLDETDTVVVPSYNCGAELDALLKAPATIRFYRVDRSARIDLGHLQQAIEPGTRAVVVTHYFGFAQPDLAAIVELCRDRDLVLIEDCAHALYSTHQGRPLGTFGDAGIFSLWKTLPTPDGGAVLAKRPLPLQRGTVKPPLGAALPAVRISVEGHLLLRHGRAGWAASKISDRLAALGAGAGKYVSRRETGSPLAFDSTLNPHVTFDPSTAHWSMSQTSYRIARRSPHAEIAGHRRRNYAFLAEELDGLSGARPLHPRLQNGTCPLSFPLVVDEPESLLRELERSGIGAELFWTDFHPAFPADEFPESTYLKTHVVTVPIHQDLDRDQVARVATAVGRWSRR
jgi:perosamine synthetase